jgi:hypothetical protein
MCFQQPEKVAMKRFALTAALLWFYCHNASATIDLILRDPHDNAKARRAAYDRPEVSALRTEWMDLNQTRFRLLKSNDVARIFGPPLTNRPADLVLPVFSENMVVLSGRSLDSHARWRTDLHPLGNLGYIEVYYQWDGTNIATAVLYHKSDKGFAPLRFREPFPQKLALDQATLRGLGKWLGNYVVPDGYTARLAWDKARFRDIQGWLNLHLPGITDLGVITIPTSTTTRINLGTNVDCIIRTSMLPWPVTTNDRYSLTLSFGTTNTEDSQTSRIVDHPGQPISFSFGGKSYRLTTKMQKE